MLQSYGNIEMEKLMIKYYNQQSKNNKLLSEEK
jgi:hypothetical protein